MSLVERIRQGETAAEEELARSFGGRVYAMAVARTRDREASRDLVQDILWAVLSALRQGQLREPDKLPAFVCGTARNLINNHLRGMARAQRATPLTSDLAVVEPDGDSESQERLELMREALGRLDASDRRILLLTLVEGLKPGEIATRLGLSSEVVRQRKSRAIKRVIGILGDRSRT